MKNYSYIILLVILIQFWSSEAQTTKTTLDSIQNNNSLFKTNPDFIIDTFTLNAKTSLTIGIFELAPLDFTLVEVPIIFKTELTNKLSALYGPKFDSLNIGLSNEVSVFSVLGLQYDVNKNAFLQGAFNYQATSPNNLGFFNSLTRESFKLRSGIKF